MKIKVAAIATAGAITLTGIPWQRAQANPALAVPGAAACVASVGCVVAVVVIAGIAYYAITYEGEQTRYVPMLDDPESAVEYWEGKTFAGSLGEAESNCEKQAEEMTRSGGSLVRSLGAEHVSGTLYKCKYQSEVPSDD